VLAVDVLGIGLPANLRTSPELATANVLKLEVFGSHEPADRSWLLDSNPLVAGVRAGDIEGSSEQGF
jgi:hypothetical protein